MGELKSKMYAVLLFFTYALTAYYFISFAWSASDLFTSVAWQWITKINTIALVLIGTLFVPLQAANGNEVNPLNVFKGYMLWFLIIGVLYIITEIIYPLATQYLTGTFLTITTIIFALFIITLMFAVPILYILGEDLTGAINNDILQK